MPISCISPHTHTLYHLTKTPPCLRYNDRNDFNMTEASYQSPLEPTNLAGVTGKLSNWILLTRLSIVPLLEVITVNNLRVDGVACAISGPHIRWNAVPSNALFQQGAERLPHCHYIGDKNSHL